MASFANSTTAPSRRQFFGSAIGAGVAAAQPPIVVVAGASALAVACLDGIARRTRIGTMAVIESWSDETFTEECQKVREAMERAATEPSCGFSDIQAKARLALNQIEAEDGFDEDNDTALVKTVLREIIRLAV